MRTCSKRAFLCSLPGLHALPRECGVQWFLCVLGWLLSSQIFVFRELSEVNLCTSCLVAEDVSVATFFPNMGIP